MTEQEILDGNKLIAEFMGWEYFEKSKTSIEGYPFGGHDYFEETDVWIKNPTDKYREILCHYGYYNIDDDLEKKDLFDDWCYKLQFNTSWDWLIPVVEKIESLKWVDEFNICYDEVAKGSYANILPSYKDTFNSLSTDIYTNKINAVYDVVIQFIKWFNQHNNEPKQNNN